MKHSREREGDLERQIFRQVDKNRALHPGMKITIFWNATNFDVRRPVL